MCGQLDIPCHKVNFVKEYWHSVFVKFIEVSDADQVDFDLFF